MATNHGLLNSEPSQTAERAEQGLPPKSYAAAAEENLPKANGEGEKPNVEQANGRAERRRSRREVIVERFTDREGEHLVSLSPEWQQSDKKFPRPRRTNSELLSGRKAGARWAKSPSVLAITSMIGIRDG